MAREIIMARGDTAAIPFLAGTVNSTARALDECTKMHEVILMAAMPLGRQSTVPDRQSSCIHVADAATAGWTRFLFFFYVLIIPMFQQIPPSQACPSNS